MSRLKVRRKKGILATHSEAMRRNVDGSCSGIIPFDADGYPVYDNARVAGMRFWNKYASSKEFYDRCVEYFKKFDMIEVEKVTAKGDKIKVMMKRPYTVEGLCRYLHVRRADFMGKMRNDERYSNIAPIIDWALSVITERLIEQCLVGNYQAYGVFSVLKSYSPEYLDKYEKKRKKQLHFEYIKIDDDVILNDSIYTSGLSENLPKGLMIGTVSLIKEKDDLFFKEVIIEPAISINKLHYVYVIY